MKSKSSFLSIMIAIWARNVLQVHIDLNTLTKINIYLRNLQTHSSMGLHFCLLSSRKSVKWSVTEACRHGLDVPVNMVSSCLSTEA